MIAETPASTISELIASNLENDQELKDIIQLAAAITGSSFIMLSIIDSDFQHVMINKGLTNGVYPLKDSFCKYALQQDNLFIISDTSNNRFFEGRTALTGDLAIRFYASMPLILHDGQKLGTFCVFDTKEQMLNEQQQLMLKILSNQVLKIIQLKIGTKLLGKNQAELEQQIFLNNNANIRLRSFFESSTNFQVLLGKEGEVIDFNKTAFNFIKDVHKSVLLRGDYFVRYVHPEFLPTFVEHYNLALAGERSSKEGTSNYDDLGIIWWEASFDTAKDSNNEIIGVSYVIRNVTKRKRREQKIIAQNQSLLKIAHIQAHDFRAPLTTIMGLMNLIKEENADAPSEYIDMLGHAVDSLDFTIRTIIYNIDNIVISDFDSDSQKH